MMNTIDPVAAREREGRKDFGLVCSACHMPSGTGNRGNDVPPLAGSEWVLAEGPNRIIRIVLNGLQGSLEVKGDQYGANVMTPFNILTDDQVAAVLTFVRHSWGNNAGPVTPEKVRIIRETTKDKDTSCNPDELKKIPQTDSTEVAPPFLPE